MLIFYLLNVVLYFHGDASIEISFIYNIILYHVRIQYHVESGSIYIWRYEFTFRFMLLHSRGVCLKDILVMLSGIPNINFTNVYTEVINIISFDPMAHMLFLSYQAIV